MANVKKDALSPLINDDQTDRIVGVKNSDASEKLFVYTDGSSGPVVITDTTASTSTTTGALRVAGGVGIGGAVNVGGAATVATNLTLTNGNLTLSNTGSASDTSGLTVTSANGATIRVQARDGAFGDPTIGTYTNKPINIKTNQVLRAQFDTSGNVQIQNGNVVFSTAGTGISFAATGNTSFNATAAAGWVQRTATNVANNDTVTIDTTVYTFKTTLTPANYEVLIGADASASLTNLRNAILGTGGTPGTDYQVPAAHPTVTADAINGLRLPLRAITAGTAGNSIALAETSAQLTVSAATLTGGLEAGGTTAELLSDYEEGTWLPTFIFSTTTGDMLLTYSTRTGRYIKIGRSVTVWCQIVGSITHSTASGQPRILGVPFTPASGVDYAIDIGATNGFTLSTNYSSMGGLFFGGIAQLRLDQFGAAVASTFLSTANVTANGTLSLNFTATYQTT